MIDPRRYHVEGYTDGRNVTTVAVICGLCYVDTAEYPTPGMIEVWDESPTVADVLAAMDHHEREGHTCVR